MTPRENAETVRRASRPPGRRPSPDVDALLRLYSPDHVLNANWGAGDERSYRGREGFRQAVDDMAELWEDFHNEVQEVVEAGDDVVVAIVRASGRGRASGTPVERETGAVIRLREGQIVSTEYYVTPEAALEAAGIDHA